MDLTKFCLAGKITRDHRRELIGCGSSSIAKNIRVVFWLQLVQ